MARARNIKPGFFKNELLVEMPVFARLLFVGLWTLADREGRLEDRPKRIKLELFPYDADDVEAGLQSLEASKFIRRYQINSVEVIQIVNFLKHQTPHGTEKDSDLPDEEGALTVHERDAKGYVSGSKRTNNVNSPANNVASPLSNSARTVKAQGNNTLNPDSLNPDSLIHSVPKGTANKLALSPSEIIFGYGLPLLTNAGTSDKQARSFLGGLRKQHGDDAVVNALRDCLKEKPLQPLEWLAAVLPPAGVATKVKTFKERDAEIGRKRWEEMTGRIHPENQKHNVLQVVGANILEITND